VLSGLNHNYQDPLRMIREQGITTSPITIEDDVWIGANSSVMSGVHIGRHCVVAGGSVVVSDVPEYSVCAGVPARVIKSYDFELKEWVASPKK
ncbi:MAG: DapH/DapD/GlmU-related protein, partial [Mucinivorans sp.]